MAIFLHHETDGSIQGIFNTDEQVYGALPEPLLEISEVQRGQIVLAPTRWRVVNGVLTDTGDPQASLQDRQAAALLEADAIAN